MKDNILFEIYEKALKQKLVEDTHSKYILVSRKKLKDLVKFTEIKKNIDGFDQTFIIGKLQLKNQLIIDDKNYNYLAKDEAIKIAEKNILESIERFLSGEEE